MNVHVIDKQNDLAISPAAVIKIIKQVITLEGHHCNEVAIHFVNTRKIKQLHAQFFNDPTPTDCITLPLDDTDTTGYIVLGEIFVCPKAALDYTKKNGGDPYAETTLYVVHGILHLLGYDDVKLSNRLIMRERETWHLQHLKKKRLILKSPMDPLPKPRAPRKKNTKKSKPAIVRN